MPDNKIILKKLSILDTIWHPESKLVFKSRTDKIVTGMYVDNNFVDLDDTAVGLCEKWGFRIDESLFETTEEDTTTTESVENDTTESVEEVTTESVEEVTTESVVESVDEVTTAVAESIEEDTTAVTESVEEDTTTDEVTESDGGDNKVCCILKTLSDVMSQIKLERVTADVTLSDSVVEIARLKSELLNMTNERNKLASKFSALKGLLG
jgi:hypothetical protein